MSDYGTDIGANPDLNFELKTGLDNLAEALARRLQTPPGGLFYDENYGRDLRDYVNKRWTEELSFEIASEAAAECEKDPRVLSAAAELIDRGNREFTLQITGETLEGEPFALVLLVGAVTVEILHDDD